MRQAIALMMTFSLLGCTEAQSPDSAAPNKAEQADASAAPAPTVRYSCADGTTIDASYPTTETARIVRDGQTVDLTIAVSASGARYVGGGWQWWTKGMTEGNLAPIKPGEDTAEAAGTMCTAA